MSNNFAVDQARVLLEKVAGNSMPQENIRLNYSNNPVILAPEVGIALKHLKLPAPLIEDKINFYLSHPDFCLHPVPFFGNYLRPALDGNFVCYQLEEMVKERPSQEEVIHVIRLYLEAIPTFPRERLPSRPISKDVDHLMEKIMTYPFSRSIRNHLLDIMRKYSFNESQIVMRVIHGDIHSDNVLCTARGPVLIDFEHICYGAAAYDFLWFLIAEDTGQVKYSFYDIVTSLEIEDQVVEDCYYLRELGLMREFLWWFKKKDIAKLTPFAAALGIEFKDLGLSPS